MVVGRCRASSSAIIPPSDHPSTIAPGGICSEIARARPARSVMRGSQGRVPWPGRSIARALGPACEPGGPVAPEPGMECKTVQQHERRSPRVCLPGRAHECRPRGKRVASAASSRSTSASSCAAENVTRKSRTSGRYGRRPDRGYPQALGEQRLARGEGGSFAAGNDRLYRRVGRQKLEAERSRGCPEARGVGKHAFASPAFLGLDGECRTCRRGKRRRHRGRVDVAAAALDQCLDQGLAARDEGAEDTERLAECAHQDRDIRGCKTGGLERAAAARAQHAEAMRIVDHEPCVMPAAHRGELAQGRDIAVHAEHAVGRDYRSGTGSERLASGTPALCARKIGSEPLFQRGRVAMRITREAGAACESRVEQRGMIQPVLEHAVAATGDRADHGEVGHVAGGEEERARTAGELRQRLFEQSMLAAMAAHQVRGAATDAPAPRGLDEGLGHPRMIGEPEIVVAAERGHVATVDTERASRRARATRRCGAPGNVRRPARRRATGRARHRGRP